MPAIVNLVAAEKALDTISASEEKLRSKHEVEVIQEVTKEFLSVYLAYCKDQNVFDEPAFEMGLHFITFYGKLSFLVDTINNKVLKLILAEFIFGYINNLPTKEES